jgi:hypothetical protein
MTTIENKYIQKLIFDLEVNGIEFFEDQEETDIGVFGENIGKRKLDNVIFSKNDYEIKIYKGIFFREGGLSRILQMIKVEKKVEIFKVVPITDDIFYETLKVSILDRFNKIYE